MKATTLLFSTILCLSSFLLNAQISKLSAPRIGGSNPPVTVKTWSNWFQLNPANYISARWIKRGTTITVELINRKNHTVNADFAANFCGETQKSMNGWKHVLLYSNKTTTLNITDASAGRCNEGFHLWYKNLRGPQQIDSGTDLNPVGN